MSSHSHHPEKLNESILLLNKHFDLENDRALPIQVDMGELRSRLSAIIGWYLDNDLEKLMHIMYRVDVEERVFSGILTSSPPGKIAAELADVVLEREWQKAETRLKYR
ncbi:hypothetical protein AB9P05_14300 [Roseivirga sp. BDSF3-8]|uniref:hypothetical protein n=1 Tax=Roseivirga sp. BDSF3-8 TaxID=3241598 RepID=UPI003531E29D